jgi:SAM-dependent methyltransferase
MKNIIQRIAGKRKMKGRSYDFSRRPAIWPNAEFDQILNLLDYTKTSGTSYSAMNFPAGYHEIVLGDQIIGGQRSPKARLGQVPYDFSGKTLLDIGCNQGGMIFALADQLRWGIGLDYDYRMVNACNRIRSIRSLDNLGFYVFDIDRDPHGLIEDFLPDSGLDVIMLLSVCMWVDQWRQLIDLCHRIAPVMVFEANGSEVQQNEQIEVLRRTYTKVTLLAETSEDDPGQKNRQLLLAEREP